MCTGAEAPAAADAAGSCFAGDAAAAGAADVGAGTAGTALGETALGTTAFGEGVTGAGTLSGLGIGTGGGTALADLGATGAAELAPAAGLAEVAGGGAGGASFLPVTGGGPAVAPLSPELASSFGVAPAAGADQLSLTTGGGFVDPVSGVFTAPADASYDFLSPADLASISGAGGEAGGGFLDTLQGGFGKAGEWAAKHPAQAGMLGLSAYNALSTPKLPGAARTAMGASSQAVQGAQKIIASGGTDTPIWQTQKKAIDQSIDQELQQAIAAMQQNAVNSGMGGANSSLVQQKIAQLTQQANTQRQQLYMQAQQQNVSNAIAELTGGNQTLSSIAQMQLAQDEQARGVAAQTAELALLLGEGGG